MATEVPKLRRCCFCIPLRRGLLFWSYLHMVAAFIIGAFGIYGWTLLLILCNTYNNYSYHDFNIIGIGAMYLNIVVNCFLSGLLTYGAHKASSIFLSLMGFYVWYILICFGASIGELGIIEALICIAIYSIVTSVLLIYGAHRKNYQILKIQYYCVIVAEFALTIIIIAEASLTIRHFLIHSETRPFWDWMYIYRSFFFVLLVGVCYIVFQLYVIVMVRSEAFKLRNIQDQFMFTNNAADAEANCTLHLNSEAEGKKH